MRRSRRISYLTQSYETNSGQEKGARSKTTQGEGMRSTHLRVLDTNRPKTTPSAAT